MTKPTLYHCADARSFRALWMLEEVGIDYDLVLLPFPPRVRQPAYLDLNPLGTIPLLVDGATRMTESAAIAQYLASRYGDTLAVAVDEPGYGAYLNALHFGEATLTFPQTLYLRYAQLEPVERRLPQAANDYAQWYRSRLRALDAMIVDGYVAAGRFTAADVSVAYALLLAERIRLPGENSPIVADYWQRLRARDGYARARARQKSSTADGW